MPKIPAVKIFAELNSMMSNSTHIVDLHYEDGHYVWRYRCSEKAMQAQPYTKDYAESTGWLMHVWKEQFIKFGFDIE